MAEFDWYGDGGPVGGYGNNTSGGGGGDDSGGGSGAVATFAFTRSGTTATAGEFLSGEYAGETATNEKIYELAAKGVAVVAMYMSRSEYGDANTFYYLDNAQNSVSGYSIEFVNVNLSGSSTLTLNITRLQNSSMDASGVTYGIKNKPIS